MPAQVSAKARKSAPGNELSGSSSAQYQQFLYYFYASRKAISEQNYPLAFYLLDFCQQLNPQDGLTKDNLGLIYSALGQEDYALELYAEAYRLAPDDCWGHYAEALINSVQPADHKKAQQVVEQVAKRNPKDADVADFLFNVYMHESQWKKALAVQDKLDMLVGYNSNSAINRYRIYTQMGKAKEAVAEIDKYLENDPNNLYFLLFRAEIYTNAERFADAFRLSERIARLMPLDEHDFNVLKRNQYCAYYVSLIKSTEGDSLITIGEIDRGYEAYEQSMALAPHNYVLNNYAYYLAIHGGDLNKAERMSEQTIKEEPDNPIYLDTYGWILHLQGQDMLALFYLRKALENVKDEENKAVITEHIKAIDH